MKHKKLILAVIAIAAAYFGGNMSPNLMNQSYDPDDLIYKFIPAAPNDWTEEFGDNERTRLIHSISELRVVVSNQSQVLKGLIDPNTGETNE